jgi:hypothetical protein
MLDAPVHNFSLLSAGRLIEREKNLAYRYVVVEDKWNEKVARRSARAFSRRLY